MAGKVSSDPNVFILPDLGEGLEEAELINWKVREGDAVEEHQILAEMETDKALVEVPSPRSGTIRTLHGEAGSIIKVGAAFVTYVGGSGGGGANAEAKPGLAGGAKPGAKAGGAMAAPSAAKAPAAEQEDAGTVVGSVGSDVAGMTARDGKALATPAVRRLARDLGVDINLVGGSGIGGRVTGKDVEAFAKGGGRGAGAAGSATAKGAGGPAGAPAAGHAGLATGGKSAAAETTRRALPTAGVGAGPSAGSHAAANTPAMPSGQGAGFGHPGAGYGYAPPPPPMPYGYAPPMPYAYAPLMPYPGYGYQGYGHPVPMAYPMPGHGVPGFVVPGHAMPGYGLAQGGGVPMAPGFVAFGPGRGVPGPAQQSAAEGTGEARQAFRGVRRTIAQKLRESVNTAVHFTVMDEADVTELDALRREIAQRTGEKISFLPFVAAAVCRAIAPALGGAFGALNARVDEGAQEIVQYGAVHLGIATDTESGLMVPVIRDAHGLGAVEMGRAIAETAGSARDRSIGRERLMGSTFTISNVGSHAGRFATPVINAPEVGILAVGKAFDGVVVREGQAVVAKVLPLSLACDHRVVDGATAALCLAEVVRLLREEAGALV